MEPGVPLSSQSLISDCVLTCNHQKQIYVIPAKRLEKSKTQTKEEPLPTTVEQRLIALKEELTKENGSSLKILQCLRDIKKNLLELRNLLWDLSIHDLILTLKNCMALEYTFKTQIEHENQSATSPNVQLKVARQDVIRLSTENLEIILSLLPPKNGYNFFEVLMSKFGPESYSYLNMFQDSTLRKGYASQGVKLDDLLQLVVTSIQKAKFSLLLGETKAIAHRHIPFTSFAATAGRLLDSIFVFLMDTIRNPIEGLDVIKVYEALIETAQATPFKRLDTSIFEKLLHFVFTAANQVPQEYFLPLLDVMVVGHWCDETFNDRERIEYKNFAVAYCNEILQAWLSRLKKAEYEDLEMETKIAALAIAVLKSFAKHWFQDFLTDSLDCMGVVNEILSVSDTIEIASVRHGLAMKMSPKVIDSSLAKCITVIVDGYTFIKIMTESLGDFLKHNDPDLEYVDKFLRIWYQAPPNFAAKSIEVTCAVVDCFAAINESLFAQLDNCRRLFCIVSILGYARDQSDVIRTKAGRCIAHFLDFKSLVEIDQQFLMDCLDVIDQCLLSSDMNCRATYSWAIGNLCDSLAKYYYNVCTRSLNWTTYTRIYRLSYRIAKGSIKIRYNGHRALGALVKWTPNEFMKEKELRDHIHNIVMVVSDQVAQGLDSKARWNASHALGNIVRKEEVWHEFHTDISGLVFDAFIRGLTKSENLKERSHCIKGIIAVQSRAEFSTYYVCIWQVMLDAYNSIPHTKVPFPYGLVDKYQEEVVHGILHLASVMILSDLSESGELKNVLLGNHDMLKVSVRPAFQQSSKPEYEDTAKACRINMEKIYHNLDHRVASDTKTFICSVFLDEVRCQKNEVCFDGTTDNQFLII